jgi:hypothetical protein
MKLLRVSSFAVCVVVSATTWAQTCSGGPDGGMDASGCQCNAPDAAASVASDAASVTFQAPAVAQPLVDRAAPATATVPLAELANVKAP